MDAESKTKTKSGAVMSAKGGRKAAPKNRAAITFEDALAELEGIVSRLESEELTLDEALGVFEDGVGLMRTCDTHLRTARGRLTELARGENGELVTRILGEDIELFIDEKNEGDTI